MGKATTILLLSAVLLCGCDSKATNGTGSQWKLSERKNPMTDAISKLYHLDALENSYGWLVLACSNGGKVSLYYHFKKQNGIPDGEADIKVRFDSDAPFNEKWTIYYSEGDATPVARDSFLQRLRGHSKLAIEIVAAGTDAFDITGFDQALTDMQNTGCPKDD